MRDSQRTAALELICRRVGHWSLNAYVLIDPVSRHSVLIDPGASPDSLMEMLGESHTTAILVTHGHSDHVEALPEMRVRLKVPVLAHRLASGSEYAIRPDRLLEDGDRITVGSHSLRVYHTPGHTPEQVCFAIEQDHRIIVGDTIFKGGPGATRSAEDFQTTLVTLRSVVLRWPDETWCYPGHGLSFNLGRERAAIERFLSRDHGRFFGSATWDMEE